MGLEGYIILIVIVIIFFIWRFSSNESEKREISNESQNLEQKLNKIESQIKELTIELSKYTYACKKCQNNLFYVLNPKPEKLEIICTDCNKTSEVNYNNAFYKIEPVINIYKKWNELENLLLDSNMYKKLMSYMQSTYIFKGDVAPKWNSSYGAYDFFYNKWRIKYFTHKYYSSNKTFNIIPRIFLAFEFKSEGSMLDKIEEKKSRAKMGKLNPNRPALSKTLEKEWNYKSITRGNKSVIIKDWAKTTNQKCPDGRKCGGVSFKELLNSNIAYGHILSQDFAKQFPHHYEQVHHPDNLYLTCKSCNSSLGGNNADKELIDRIKNESGTIGDWLRNYINEIKSIKP